MADSIPITTDDTLAQLRARRDAVRRVKVRNAAQARARAAELFRIENILSEAARQAADATAQKQIADKSNGYANGHSSDVATELSDELMDALAKGIKTVLREELAPRDARLDEVARVV